MFKPVYHVVHSSRHHFLHLSWVLWPFLWVQAAPAQEVSAFSTQSRYEMFRFVAIVLGVCFVPSGAFVAPGARPSALRSTRYEQMQSAEIPQAKQQSSESSPFAAVVMASCLGLMLGFTSSPNVARAEEAAAPVLSDKKAKLKAEVEKAQAAIKKNAKSKEERLKEQIAQLKEVEKTAETDFATK